MAVNEQNDQEVPLIQSGILPTKQKRWFSKALKSPILASIILWISLSFLAIIIYISIDFEQVRRGTFGDCGKSPSEARSLGCLYDVTSSSWLPPECYDAELIDEFLAVRDWVWYYNVVGKIAAPREEVLAGNLDGLIVTREYHMFHCTHQWRKLHRGIANGVIDTYIGNYHHTSHCEEMLTMGGHMNDTDTILVMKFVQCQYV